MTDNADDAYAKVDKNRAVLLSIVGCISAGPTAALIASSAQWKTLINIGLLMGVLDVYKRQTMYSAWWAACWRPRWPLLPGTGRRTSSV